MLNIWILVKAIVKVKPGLEVIKLEYSLTLKIKRNDWLLADTCHFAHFEFENELTFYNLKAWFGLN